MCCMISAKPIIQPFSFPQYVNVDERIGAMCNLKSGTKPFQFRWTKDNEDIKKIPNVSVDTQSDYSVLTVNPITKENSGNYTCTVTNRFGSDSHTAGFETKGNFNCHYLCCKFNKSICNMQNDCKENLMS